MILPTVLLLLPLLVWRVAPLNRAVTRVVGAELLSREQFRLRYTPLDYLRHHLLLALLSYAIIWFGALMSLLLDGGHESWQIFRDENIGRLLGTWLEMVIFTGVLFYPFISGEMFKESQSSEFGVKERDNVFKYALAHYLQLLGYSYLLLSLYHRLVGIRMLEGAKSFML